MVPSNSEVMDIHGYAWISMDIFKSPRISADSMDIYGSNVCNRYCVFSYLKATSLLKACTMYNKKVPKIQITDLGGNGQIRYLRILLFLC